MKLILMFGALLVACENSWATLADARTRTMPHEEKCAVPLPNDFWDDPAAASYETSEKWAWNERICLGQRADMRDAPDGSDGEKCEPAEIEKSGEAVPAHRELRPEFLELVLSHEPWVSSARHPDVGVECALVRGDIHLSSHHIAPAFWFLKGKIDGNVDLLRTKFQRTLSLSGTTVTGTVNADGVLVGDDLIFSGGNFNDVDLLGARVASDVSFNGSRVTGLLNADRMEVGGGLFVRDGNYNVIDLLHATIGRTVTLTNSTVTGKLNGDRMEVSGGMSLDRSELNDVDLPNVRIAGTVSFTNSTVVGRLDAFGIAVGRDLYLDVSEFKDISLISGEIGGHVQAIGSTVTGVVDASGVKVGSGMVMRGASFGHVALINATIGGEIAFTGSTVARKLNADRMKVGDGLFFRDAKFSNIDLISATVSRVASFSGSSVAGLLDASGMEVGRGLILRDGDFEDIDLDGASIVGSVEFRGATVSGRVDANRMEVGDGLFLRNAELSEIDLLSTMIGGILDLSGSTFSGELDLTGAAIEGELHLSSGWKKDPPTWKNGASLVLRNVSAHALQAQGDSWSISGGDGLVPTDLTGFTINRLQGTNTSGGTSMGDESAAWLVGWIEAQRDHGEVYDPQPYTQLAEVLQDAGARDKAKAIRYAKFLHKRDHDLSMTPIRRAVLTIERYFLGYGVYPFRVLYWFVGLVVLGWLFAQFSNERSVRRGMGLWYSLENALPIIDTNERFRTVDHGRVWLTHFFHIQKAFGFLLATIFVGALTLLSV